MTDIVERLRSAIRTQQDDPTCPTYWSENDESVFSIQSALVEAADEIERLRAALQECAAPVTTTLGYKLEFSMSEAQRRQRLAAEALKPRMR